ncbi:hypothetical protein PG988_007513 [Apiospora saccharicola]
MGQFCQHCRGERTGTASEVYFDRVAALDKQAETGLGLFPGSRKCHKCYAHLDGYPEEWAVGCYQFHYPLHMLKTHWQDKADLRSLCLVSRTLRGAAQPVLYHLYRPGKTATRQTTTTRGCSGSSGPSRTGLAARTWSPRLLPSLTELSLGNELLEPFEDYIPAYLEQEDYLCLRTFEVSTNAAGHSTYFKLKKLSKLEGRIIELSRDLRVLKLHLCDSLGLGRNAGDGDKEGLSPKFSLPHLQSLRITEGRLDADELCHLLSACPAAGSLREFVYDAAEVYLHVLHNCTGDSFRTPAENWMRTRKPDVDPSAVIAALEHLQPKLESLHLNVHQFMDIPHKGPFAPLRSLSDFTALRNLLLDWRSICGGYANQNDTDDTQRLVRLLPESIRSLYIVGCAQEIHPQRLGRSLEGLAAARDRGRFADLQRVGCDIRRSYRYWGTSSKNRDDPGGAGLNAAWKDMFGVGGVQFEYDLGWEGSPSPGGTYYDDTGYRESSGPFSPPISMSDYEIDEDL